MLWLWIFASILAGLTLYIIFIRSSPRNIILGAILALAIFAVIGTIYLVATGKLQWAWASAFGIVPWVSRWFFLRNLVQKWQGKATSHIPSQHLTLTLSWVGKPPSNQKIDGTLNQSISLDPLKTLKAGHKLSVLSDQELQRLADYFAQCDEQALHLLTFYCQTTSRSVSMPQKSSSSFSFGNETMNRQQALEVLGLTEDSLSNDLIITAHRRLIAKLHPDKDGSTYLAHIINAARDVLLKK